MAKTWCDSCGQYVTERNLGQAVTEIKTTIRRQTELAEENEVSQEDHLDNLARTIATSLDDYGRSKSDP